MTQNSFFYNAFRQASDVIKKQHLRVVRRMNVEQLPIYHNLVRYTNA